MDDLEKLEPALGSVTRNIVIRGKRTSVRMEAAFWDGLAEIAQREGLALNDLCEQINDARLEGGNLTSAIRVFVQSYFAMLALRSVRGGPVA
jgi:predicted DNA-binding ribbon-helix-helix protein